jgi:hypothetical protein
VLVYLRKGEMFPGLAAAFGVSTITAWRYVNETVVLLAACAPKLRKAVREAKKKGYLRRHRRHPYPDRPGCRRPAVLFRQAQEARDEPAGHRRSRWEILWVSGALPGSVHDKKAEWIWGILAELETGAWSSWPTRATSDRNTRRSRTREEKVPYSHVDGFAVWVGVAVVARAASGAAVVCSASHVSNGRSRSHAWYTGWTSWMASDSISRAAMSERCLSKAARG